MTANRVSRRTAGIVIGLVVLVAVGFGAWSIFGDHFVRVSQKEAIEQGSKEADAMEQFYRERLPKKSVPPKSSPATARQ